MCIVISHREASLSRRGVSHEWQPHQTEENAVDVESGRCQIVIRVRFGTGIGLGVRTFCEAAVAAVSATNEKNAMSLKHRCTSRSLGGAAPVSFTPLRK